jgi:hypothetical protein
VRAQPVNSIFSLRALAAQKLRREQKVRCRLAAGDAAIRAGRSIDQKPNLHIADFPAVRCDCKSLGGAGAADAIFGGKAEVRANYEPIWLRS